MRTIAARAVRMFLLLAAHCDACREFSTARYFRAKAARVGLRWRIPPYRPLTAAEAQEAYDEAPAEPLSEERIEEIVRYATRGE